MKTFITYNQALVEDVEDILSQLSIRGFTLARCSRKRNKKGEPHLGTHAWPSKTWQLYVLLKTILHQLQKRIQALDNEAPEQGLRIFFWETIDV